MRYNRGMGTRGIHVVWTTYMTWPPGDRRGHWSPMFDLYGRLKMAGHRINLPHDVSVTHAQVSAADPPKVLTPGERVIVAHELSHHVTPGKPGSICYAAAIEDNHVHLLLGPLSEDIGKYVGRLKGRTSSVMRKLPANADRKRIWTAGYWKVFLFDDEAVTAVARYIGQHNVRRGLPATPYDWVTPLVI